MLMLGMMAARVCPGKGRLMRTGEVYRRRPWKKLRRQPREQSPRHPPQRLRRGLVRLAWHTGDKVLWNGDGHVCARDGNEIMPSSDKSTRVPGAQASYNYLARYPEKLRSARQPLFFASHLATLRR